LLQKPQVGVSAASSFYFNARETPGSCRCGTVTRQHERCVTPL
jgi:hypothetical protein